jgi:Arf-GAP/coiled-coil/ANK repeat/PH domain-containing protein
LRRRPRSRDSRGEKKSQSAKRLPSVSETKSTSSSSSDIKSKVNEENSKDTRTKYGGSATQSLKLEKEIDETNEASSEGSKGSDSGSSNTEYRLVNADVLMFGKNFEKQPLEGSIELSSDQDSTGGEEDEFIGNYIVKPTFLCIIFMVYDSQVLVVKE